jgi:hypothetical protein
MITRTITCMKLRTMLVRHQARPVQPPPGGGRRATGSGHRDKDGTTLVMTTASVLERAQEINGTAVALVQVAEHSPSRPIGGPRPPTVTSPGCARFPRTPSAGSWRR